MDDFDSLFTTDNTDIVQNSIKRVYRALRTEEVYTYSQGLYPPCRDCGSPHADACCSITHAAHITRGSTAKVKSRFISTTLDESIAAAWCANASGQPADRGLSATYAVLDVPVDGINSIEINDATIPHIGLGATAANFAKSSKEVLVRDHIPPGQILQIWSARTISKGEYLALPPVFLHGTAIAKTLTGVKKGRPLYILCTLK